MRIKKNSKLKGMTLVEVIVALAVFTIMSSLLVTACIGVSTSITHTNRFVREVNVQSPVAENGITDAVKVDAVSDGTNTIVIKNKSGSAINEAVVIDSYTVKKTDGRVSGRFKYFKYNS